MGEIIARIKGVDRELDESLPIAYNFTDRFSTTNKLDPDFRHPISEKLTYTLLDLKRGTNIPSNDRELDNLEIKEDQDALKLGKIFAQLGLNTAIEENTEQDDYTYWISSLDMLTLEKGIYSPPVETADQLGTFFGYPAAEVHAFDRGEEDMISSVDAVLEYGYEKEDFLKVNSLAHYMIRDEKEAAENAVEDARLKYNELIEWSEKMDLDYHNKFIDTDQARRRYKRLQEE